MWQPAPLYQRHWGLSNLQKSLLTFITLLVVIALFKEQKCSHLICSDCKPLFKLGSQSCLLACMYAFIRITWNSDFCWCIFYYMWLLAKINSSCSHERMASLTDVAIIQGTHKLMQFLSGFACTTLLNIYFVSKLSGYWQMCVCVCVCVCVESGIITTIKYLWRLSEIETRQLNGWWF